MKITKTKHGYTTVIGIRDETGKVRSKRFSSPDKTLLILEVGEYKSRNRLYHESKTFRDSLERYITAREGRRSPATIRGYKSIQNTLLNDYGAFCGLSVDRVTDASVQTVINDKKPKTARNYVGLINAVLIAEGCKPVKVILPEKQSTDRPIPSEGEIKMLLCLLHNHKLEIPFQLAISGLRRGEICALTLDDLDGDTIHIHKSKVMAAGGEKVTRRSAKTDTSNRYITIPHELAEKIRRQGYFTKYTPNGLTVAYTKFLVRNKFPHYRLHDCRHFFASFCHSKGVPEADILAGGGWKTANIMKSVYRHSMAKNKANNQINSLLTK